MSSLHIAVSCIHCMKQKPECLLFFSYMKIISLRILTSNSGGEMKNVLHQVFIVRILPRRRCLLWSEHSQDIDQNDTSISTAELGH